MENSDTPFNWFWNTLSTIMTILGLVSITDNIFIWKSIIPYMVSGYRAVVHFPIELLNLSIAPFWLDYFFIGSICGISYTKALSYAWRNKLISLSPYPNGVKIFYFSLYLLLWPYGIVVTVRQVFFKESDVNEKKIKTNFLNWLTILLLSFIIVLIVNSLLLVK